MIMSMESDNKDSAEAFSDFLEKGRFRLLQKNIFFDTEFYSLYEIFAHLNEVFNNIKRRIENKKELEISASKFAHIDILKNKRLCPDLCYNFVHLSDVIKIVRVRKEYFIYSTFKPPAHSVAYRGITFVYGAYTYERFECCVQDWLDTVRAYINAQKGDLF